MTLALYTSRRRVWLGIAMAAIIPVHAHAQMQRVATVRGTVVTRVPPMDRRAGLLIQDVALSVALRELQVTSGVALAYSPSLLPEQPFVSCDCAHATMREALRTLLAGSGFTVREVDGQILLLPGMQEAVASENDLYVTGDVSPVALADYTRPAVTIGVPPRFDSTTITGRVTSDAGAPIGGAIVLVRGLRLSTISNENGAYRLYVPPDRFVARAETLTVTRLGFRPVNVMFVLAPGQVVVDVVMSTQSVSLEQIVVTGTAGNQERRAQAAVVASVDATEIMAKAPVRTVNELLYGRTTGVSMTGTSGTAGTNTRIDIRGQASVSLSNYPLVFIDGVRVTTGPRSVVAAPGGTTAGAGGQQFSALNDINPDDIESIEIVKGPAAATLYGADASAGVIQILTKKGRVGSRGMTHKVTTEYYDVDPNFTPYTNYGRCTAALVAPTSASALCRGQTVGAVVSDNVLVRNNVFDNGWAGSLLYSVQGGGDAYGYYGSFSAQDEQGTTPSSFINHRTGRGNFNWTATPKLTLNMSAGLVRANDRLPQGDQSSFGFLVGGDFGSPLSVTTGADGKLAGGWFNNNLNVDAIAAIKTKDLTIRSTPSVQMLYTPFAWLSNRVTFGGDFLRTTASQMYPKNAKNWYSAIANTGSIAVNEANTTIYTVDYLGNISRRFGGNGWLSSDLSFGSQWINTVATSVGGTGQGLLTNSNSVISAATTTTASQGYGQSKSLGFFVQEQVGLNDRLYIQLGARVDRNSAFGSEVGIFVLPKAGISYVVSSEPFWKGVSAVVSTFRVRSAYGTTGRSPSATAALQTYSRSNFITDAGVVQPGVSPGSPGNPNLKPERGTEFEAGFDAGFLDDRIGLELTYFAKVSKDLLLTQPLAPSSGFASSPLINVGEVSNKGLELAVRATPLVRSNVTWDLGFNLNTLSNKIVSMGAITPFVSGNNQCFKPGVEVAAWCVPRVRSIDTVARRVTVSDTAEVAGGQLPKYVGSLTSTLT
ncbi:MAG: SusC/RagA family TonB-linked outer membrane protein, partial [Gemmatimonadaceae bacterium]